MLNAVTIEGDGKVWEFHTGESRRERVVNWLFAHDYEPVPNTQPMRFIRL